MRHDDRNPPPPAALLFSSLFSGGDSAGKAMELYRTVQSAIQIGAAAAPQGAEPVPTCVISGMPLAAVSAARRHLGRGGEGCIVLQSGDAVHESYLRSRNKARGPLPTTVQERRTSEATARAGSPAAPSLTRRFSRLCRPPS